MHWWGLTILIVTVLRLRDVQTERIILLSPLATRGQENIFNVIAELLIEDGHDVTMVLPGMNKLEGVEYINTSHITEAIRKDIYSEYFRDMFEGMSTLKLMVSMVNVFWKLDAKVSDYCLNTQDIVDLYKLPPGSYDLVISSAHFNLCTIPLAFVQKVPLVLLSPTGLPHHIYSSQGNPNIPSINPCIFLELDDKMSYTERVINTLGQVIPSILLNAMTFPAFDKLFHNKTSLNTLSVIDVMSEASIVFSNTHHTMTYPRALLPNIIEIGGLSCTAGKSLSKDWESFLNRDDKGFIYLSLGTSIPGNFVPADKLKILMSVFSKLPYQVVWRFDLPELLPDLPKNVRVTTWAPQQDLLGHPKIKLFITQGGMLSIQEAACHGVPILGLPFFGDQLFNARHAQNEGYGLFLEWNRLSETSLLTAIQKITGDIRFKQRSERRAVIFRDDPMQPSDKVMFWIKYVLRHRGAPSLKTPVRHVPFYQYYLLDVILLIWIVFWIFYRVITDIVYILCCRPKATPIKVNWRKKIA